MAKMQGQSIKGQKFTGTKKENAPKGKVVMTGGPKETIHSNGNLAQRVNKQIKQATKKVSYGKKS